MLFDEKLPFTIVIMLEEVTGIDVVDLETQDKAIRQLIHVGTEDAIDLFNFVMEIFNETYLYGDVYVGKTHLFTRTSEGYFKPDGSRYTFWTHPDDKNKSIEEQIEDLKIMLGKK